MAASPVASSSKKSLTPARKHRKLLKDGSGAEVWPESIEAVFVQGLRDYWESPYATYSQPRGRSRWRNQYLVDYLQKAGINRTKKQVASHIQVLRNMWKGQPEFYLVAAGDEPPCTEASIKLEDSTLISLEMDDADNSSSPSPEFSPVDFPPTPTHLADALMPLPKEPTVYSNPSASMPTALSIYPIDNLTSQSQNSLAFPSYYSLETNSFPESAISSRPTPSFTQQYPNYCTAFRLLADGMTPFSVKLDTLTSSPFPPHSALVLKIKIAITSIDDTLSPPSLHGFSGSISLARVWSNAAKCITRVHTHNVCISDEVAPLQISNVEYGVANILLPESTLSRCRWLDKDLQTRVTQEIIVDSDTLLYIIYDLDRSRGAMPSAELQGYQTRKTTVAVPSQPNYSLTTGSPTSNHYIFNATSLYSRPSTQTSLSGALTPSFSLSSSATVY